MCIWQPTPVFLPGESHGQRGLVGYGLWGCKESDTTEQLTHTHTHTHTNTHTHMKKEAKKRVDIWDFSGGPMAKTLNSQCRGSRFDPWSGI